MYPRKGNVSNNYLLAPESDEGLMQGPGSRVESFPPAIDCVFLCYQQTVSNLEYASFSSGNTVYVCRSPIQTRWVLSALYSIMVIIVYSHYSWTCHNYLTKLKGVHHWDEVKAMTRVMLGPFYTILVSRQWSVYSYPALHCLRSNYVMHQ